MAQGSEPRKSEPSKPDRPTSESGTSGSARSGSSRSGSGTSGSPKSEPRSPRGAGPRGAGQRGSGSRSAGERSTAAAGSDSRGSGRSTSSSSDRKGAQRQGSDRKGPKGQGSGPRTAQGSERAATGPRPPRAADKAGRDPVIPEGVTGDELDRHARNDLRSLPDELATRVARHLVMVAQLLDEDPEQAWAHAQTASRMAGRLGVVREAAGIAAYRNGLYAQALQELRAARRMSGGVEHWPVMADCERGLGRPKKALEMAGSPEVAQLDTDGRVEMRIVASGARADLGQLEAAVVTLQCPELNSTVRADWSVRLKYAYADALLRTGRVDEAREWFERTTGLDVDQITDSDDRIADLDGVIFEDLDEDIDDAEMDGALDGDGADSPAI